MAGGLLRSNPRGRGSCSAAGAPGVAGSGLAPAATSQTSGKPVLIPPYFPTAPFPLGPAFYLGERNKDLSGKSRFHPLPFTRPARPWREPSHGRGADLCTDSPGDQRSVPVPISQVPCGDSELPKTRCSLLSSPSPFSHHLLLSPLRKNIQQNPLKIKDQPLSQRLQQAFIRLIPRNPA